MKRLFPILLFLLPGYGIAQGKDTVLRYLDYNLQLVPQSKAIYYGVSVRQGDHFMLYALYPDTTPVLRAYYKDRQLKIKDGPFEQFYPGNHLALSCYFENNQLNGPWMSWHNNGVLKDSGQMEKGEMVGEWHSWHENSQLAVVANFRPYNLPTTITQEMTRRLGSNAVRTGPAKTWYRTGQLESEGSYQDNLMAGTWHWYHENGKPATVEVYEAGKLARLTCYDSVTRDSSEFCPLARPAVLKGYGDYKQFIREHLTWPSEASRKKLSGTVTLRIRVNQQGVVEKLEIESEHPLLKQAVADLFNYMKEWYPAVSHNRAVDWEDEMVIPFMPNDE